MGRLFCIFIGISDYDEKGFSIPYASTHDANVLADIFQELFSLHPETICRLLGRVSKEEIVRYTQDFVEQSKPDDILIFYYSGHGIMHQSRSYIMPSSGKISVIPQTCIALEEILHQTAKFQRKVFIFDACHSGMYTLDGLSLSTLNSLPSFSEFRSDQSIALISASSAYEYSHVDDHVSVFTKYLIEGMRVAISNDPQRVELLPIFNYIFQRVSTHTHGKQNPSMSFSGSPLIIELSRVIDTSKRDANLQHLHDFAKQAGIALLDVTEYDETVCREVGVHTQIITGNIGISQKGDIGTMADNLSPQFQSDLRKGIIQCFSTGDLKVLCADLGIDYESLGGEGKEVKALELISYMNRRGQIAQLLEYCVSARPQYTWPQANLSQRISDQIREGRIPNVKIVILFLASDPTDAARLRLGKELREIQEKLQLAKLRDRFDLQQRMSVRPADISQALLDTRPQVVHFSGHGTTSGELCFENVIGKTQPVSADALAVLFEQFTDQVKCVILNACFSEVQAKAIAQHISYVIGMNQALGDQAAIAFAIGFYQALGAGRTIEEAYKLGCAQIRLQGIPEHQTPILIGGNSR